MESPCGLRQAWSEIPTVESRSRVGGRENSLHVRLGVEFCGWFWLSQPELNTTARWKFCLQVERLAAFILSKVTVVAVSQSSFKCTLGCHIIAWIPDTH